MEMTLQSLMCLSAYSILKLLHSNEFYLVFLFELKGCIYLYPDLEINPGLQGVTRLSRPPIGANSQVNRLHTHSSSIQCSSWSAFVLQIVPSVAFSWLIWQSVLYYWLANTMWKLEDKKIMNAWCLFTPTFIAHDTSHFSMCTIHVLIKGRVCTTENYQQDVLNRLRLFKSNNLCCPSCLLGLKQWSELQLILCSHFCRDS